MSVKAVGTVLEKEAKHHRETQYWVFFASELKIDDIITELESHLAK